MGDRQAFHGQTGQERHCRTFCEKLGSETFLGRKMLGTKDMRGLVSNSHRCSEGVGGPGPEDSGVSAATSEGTSLPSFSPQVHCIWKVCVSEGRRTCFSSHESKPHLPARAGVTGVTVRSCALAPEERRVIFSLVCAA